MANEPVDGAVNFSLEDVTLRDLQPDELLVRIVASGLCHTDIVFAQSKELSPSFPRVLGHEGWCQAEDFDQSILTLRRRRIC